MKRIIKVLFISLLFLNCNSNQKNKTAKESIIREPEFNFIMPVFVDTFDITCNYKNEIWLKSGSYYPIYVGPAIDSLIVPIRSNIEHYFYYDNYSGEHDHYMCKDSLDIDLMVDTANVISKYFISYDCIAKKYDTTAFYSIPVLIGNKTKDTIAIGYGDHIPIYMEAQDKYGIWKQIEEPYIYMCGTGLNGIFLPPGEIAITSSNIYKGNFKTKLRLKYYYGMCSEEFIGSINISQFESEFDRAGNRKTFPNQ